MREELPTEPVPDLPVVPPPPKSEAQLRFEEYRAALKELHEAQRSLDNTTLNYHLNQNALARDRAEVQRLEGKVAGCCMEVEMELKKAAEKERANDLFKEPKQ